MFDALTINEAIELQHRLNRAHAETIARRDACDFMAGNGRSRALRNGAERKAHQYSQMLSEQTQIMMFLMNRATD